MDKPQNGPDEKYPPYRETPKPPFRWKRLLVKAGILALLIGIGVLWFHLRTLSIRKKMRARLAVVDKQIEKHESKVFHRARRPGLIDGNAAAAYNSLHAELENNLDFTVWRNWERQRPEKRKWEDIDAFLDNASKIIMPEMKRIQNMRIVKWSPGYRNFGFGNYNVVPLRRFAKLIKDLRNRAGQRGNYKEAVELTVILFQLAADSQQIDWILADLIGISIAGLSFKLDKADFGAWELPQSEWKDTSDSLDRIRSEFRTLSDRLPCELACAEYFIGNTSLISGLWFVSLDSWWWDAKLLPFTQSDMWDNLLVLKGTYKKMTAFVESDPSLEEVLKFKEEEERFVDDATYYSDRQLAALTMPHISTTCLKQFRFRAYYRLFRAAVALRYHEVVHDKFPERLDEIDSAVKPLPWELLDPYDGKPLRYKLSEDGRTVTLWAIGPDGKDDNAEMDLKKRKSGWLGGIVRRALTGDIIIKFTVK